MIAEALCSEVVGLTVCGAAPADSGGLVADERLALAGQADRVDVLLEYDVLAQPHHGQVVLEVGRVVVGMHLPTLNQ